MEQLKRRMTIGGVIIIVFLIALYFKQSPPAPLSGVNLGNEYHATTTSGQSGTMTDPQLLKTGPGALGSVIITQAVGGQLFIYDATTTSANLRTRATSTIILAAFPDSPTVGTYVFDEVFFDGLILDWVGTAGTSTITYR